MPKVNHNEYWWVFLGAGNKIPTIVHILYYQNNLCAFACGNDSGYSISEIYKFIKRIKQPKF